MKAVYALLIAALVGAGVFLGIVLGEAPSASKAPAAAATRPAALLPYRSPQAGPETRKDSSGAVQFKVKVNPWEGTRPAEIGFSGDSGNYAERINWPQWGPTKAVGLGVVGLDNCVPNCAEGTYTYQGVTITLTDPVNGIWTKMTEAIQGQPPEHYTYPGWWAEDANRGSAMP